MLGIFLNLFLGIAEQSTIYLCVGLFMKNNDRQFFRKRFWYIFAFSLCIIGGFFLSVSLQNLGLPWLGLAFQLISFMILGRTLFHKRLQSLLLDLVFTGILFLAVEAGIYVVNIIFYSVQIRDILWLGNLTIGIKILCMLLTTFFAVSWLKQLKTVRVRKRQAAAILALPFFTIFYFYSLIEMSSVYIQLKDITLLLANIIALVLLNFYFLYLWRHFLYSRELEKKLELFQTQSSLQYRYYEQLEEKYKGSRKIIHDMKNHLSAIRQLYEKGASPAGDQYMEDLYHMLNKIGEKFYSSNKMLNIICNDKLSFARQKGIAVTAEIGDVDLSEIKDVDITTIFANLLDNAIEAAEATASPYLKLKIQEVHSFRVISLVNSSSLERKKSGHMGLGLENVRHTVEKYSGTINWEQFPHKFQTSILLPRKENL